MSKSTVPGGGEMRVALLLVIAAALFGCAKEPKGPEAVKWDRDDCELCRMILSDRAFVAETRAGPKRRIAKFDDIGCAFFYLKEHGWLDDPKTEFWVADYQNDSDNTTWLDARKAYYVPNLTTPMDYGFGATSEKVPGVVDYETVKAAVFKKGLHRGAHGHHGHGKPGAMHQMGSDHSEHPKEQDHSSSDQDGHHQQESHAAGEKTE